MCTQNITHFLCRVVGNVYFRKKYNIMRVLTFTARDFRSRQAHLFDLADSGERVIIRRGNKKAYTLVPVKDDEMTITPELQAKIDRALASVKAGNYTELTTPEDIDKYFASL